MMTPPRQNFRSAKGCCICTTKSSTSRFTASTNYEMYFEKCFLVQGRSGDICNACVLIVKRYMKKPNSGQHWHHIVDNGSNKKQRKRIALQVRQQERNGDYADGDVLKSVTSQNSVRQGPRYLRHKYRPRQHRDEGIMTEWQKLTDPSEGSFFYPHHNPYPCIFTSFRKKTENFEDFFTEDFSTDVRSPVRKTRIVPREEDVEEGLNEFEDLNRNNDCMDSGYCDSSPFRDSENELEDKRPNGLLRLAEICDNQKQSSLDELQDSLLTMKKNYCSSVGEDSGCEAADSSSVQTSSAPGSVYTTPYSSPCPSVAPTLMEDEDSHLGFVTPEYHRDTGSGGVRSKRKGRCPSRLTVAGGRLGYDVTDHTYWTQKDTCCGRISIGQNGEVLVMAEQYRPSGSTQHDSTCEEVSRLLRRRRQAGGRQQLESVQEEVTDSYDRMVNDMAVLRSRSPAGDMAVTHDQMLLPEPRDAYISHRAELFMENLRCSGDDENHSLNSYYDCKNNNKVYSQFRSPLLSKKDHVLRYLEKLPHSSHPVVTVSAVDALGALDLTKKAC